MSNKVDPLYSRWDNMKQRCYNPSNPNYTRYGGRGITVCNEWRYSFDSFKDWSLKNGFRQVLRIDRRDNDKGYSPENCRWVTEIVNQNNKCNNIYFDYKGKKKTIPEIALVEGINKATLWHRVAVFNMSIEDAICYRKKTKERTDTLKYRCDKLGINYNAVKIRKYKYGISEAEAISYYL